MRSAVTAFAIALVAASGSTRAEAAVSCGIPSFRAAASYLDEGPLTQLFSEDLNEDRRVDLVGVFTAGYSYSVYVRLGLGDGTFGPAAHFPLAAPPGAAAVADFNRDGHVDIAVATVAPGAVEVKLGNGAGGFSPSQILSTDIDLGPIAVADFSGDGFPDLVYERANSTRLWLLPGTGTGTFTTAVPSPPLTFVPQRLIAGDFNGDARADIAAVTLGHGFPEPGTLELLVATGDRQFLVSAVVNGNTRLDAVGDFTGDGRLDVLASSPGPFGSPDAFMHMYPGDGAGHLGPPITFATPLVVDAAADMNGDGALDLVVESFASESEGSAAGGVMIGDGSGHFGAAIAIHGNTGTAGFPVVAGDVDADGRVDLVTAADGFTVFVSTCGNRADLAVSISEPAEPAVSPGTVTYTIQVANRGPDVAAVSLVLRFDAPIVTYAGPEDACALNTGVDPLYCQGMVVTGNAPGNTITVTVIVRPAADPITARATLRTAVLDPDPGNNVAEETTQVVAVGGSSFRIAAAPGGGVALTWSPDGSQAGFQVVRLSGGVVTTLPAGGALPSNASGFVDPSPIRHAFNCYTVVPLDSAGAAFGRSTLLCLQADTASPAGGPGFTLGLLNLGADAEVTWSAPAGARVAIHAHPLDGSPAWRVHPAEASGVTTFSTSDVNTCYVLYAYVLNPPAPPTVLGNSAVQCVVPRFGTIQ